ncbi:MAG: TonB family protein [Cyclobacteriaceae bacterium]
MLKDQKQQELRSDGDQNKFELKKEDYDDLITIKRIRDQKQQQRSTLFFFVGLCITLASLFVVFNWKFYNTDGITDLGQLDNDNFEEVQDIPNTEQPPPPPPQVLQQPIVVEVPDEVILEEVEVNLDVEVSEEMVVEEVEFEPVEEEVAEEIFEIVENFPEPIGGYQAFYAYVMKNLVYPRHALQMNIQGRVFVKFVVDKDGSITSVQALKGIGGGCDEEAVKIVENAPRWNPGKQRGQPVKVYMTLPITFKLVD